MQTLSSGGALRRACTTALSVLPLIVLTVWDGNTADPGGPAEFFLFGPAGRDLLTGCWTDVFAQPQVQAGPFELLPYGLAQLMTPEGLFAWTLISVAAVTLLLLGVLLAVAGTVCAPGTLTSRALLPVAFALVLLGVPDAFHMGHPAQVVIPALWLLAARCALDERFLAAGLIIGASAGWEVWGVLGAPVVLLAARPDLLRAAAGAVAALVCVYGPFLLLGRFEMFSFAWGVSSESLVGILRPDWHSFPWSLRLLQALVAVGAAAIVARLSRRSEYGGCLVVLTVLSARLALDPLLYPYYWIAPLTVGAVVLGLSLRRRRQVETLGAAVLLGVLMAPPTRSPWGALAVIVAITVIAMVLRSSARSPRPTTEPVPSR